MTAIYAALAVITAWLAVILSRAALHRPPAVEMPEKPSHAGRFDLDKAAGRLSRMVRCRTVAPENDRRNGRGEKEAFREFEKYRRLLEQFYPLAHRTLNSELIKGHSLLYRWPGKRKNKPLVLMAHYDVVPADGEQWQHPPFSGLISDGQIWGRGTIDDKVVVCAIFEAIENLLAEKFIPEQDIYLAFGHDEETAGTGAREIVEVLKSRKVKPTMVLDEGGMITEGFFPGVSNPIAVVAAAEKGSTNLEVILEGTGGHSSSPARFNQLGELSRIILQVAKKPFRAYMPPEIEQMFSRVGRYSPFPFRVILANLWCFKPLLIALLPLMGRELYSLCRSTAVFTMVEGSDAPNVLPNRVRAVANLRLSARDPHDQALAHITAQALEATKKSRRASDPLKVKIDLLAAENATPSSDTGSKAFAILEETIGKTFPGTIVTPFVYAGMTDSRYYHAICDNVYRFLPIAMGKEELRTIHGVDERLPVEKLGLAIEFFLNLIDGFNSDPEFRAG